MRVLLSLLIIFFSLSSLTLLNQSFEEGETVLYVARSGMMHHNKYAILEIKDSLAKLEIYAKYDGEIVPVNMAWNSKIDPEKYILNRDSVYSDKQTFKGNIVDITVYEKHAHVSLKSSFMGGFELQFIRVNNLPNKFEHVRNHAYMFTGRNAIGYQFKSEDGYTNYDEFMERTTLYKECDKLSFHDFVAKYDSVHKTIYKEIYSIHDSLKIQSTVEEEEELVEE